MKPNERSKYVGAIMASSLRRLWGSTSDRSILSGLIFHWPTVIGEPLWRVTRVEAFQSGVLHLCVAHGHELSLRYQEEKVCQRLNSWLKASSITSLRLRSSSPWQALPGQDPSEKQVAATHLLPGFNLNPDLVKAVSKIQDPTLRDILLGLGAVISI